ncbi:hypothetical protein CDAR_187291 [Caerostris darwini]|uniref:Uncharacterized protein n=1 Tax=Caerostris darwini TaxID=1538125 RepID=A0AAV4R679_9ARAC|nr:hypothetical protein CDAR_187291 [Caerostris darwini]
MILILTVYPGPCQRHGRGGLPNKPPHSSPPDMVFRLNLGALLFLFNLLANSLSLLLLLLLLFSSRCLRCHELQILKETCSSQSTSSFRPVTLKTINITPKPAILLPPSHHSNQTIKLTEISFDAAIAIYFRSIPGFHTDIKPRYGETERKYQKGINPKDSQQKNILMILILTVYPGLSATWKGEWAPTLPNKLHPILPPDIGFPIEPQDPAVLFNLLANSLPAALLFVRYSLLVVFGNGPNSGSDI